MENSKIEWTTHTFNPWVGCTKVSPGCENCYAEADMDKRRGFARWGKGQKRRKTSDTYWKQPLKWNRDAAGMKEKPRVFCASLADVFDEEVPDKWRDELASVIGRTPNLNWMLLTKRPENFKPWVNFGCFSNVWFGVSVEDQKRFDLRIPLLMKAPAKVKFLSVEPMLGPIDLGRWPYPTANMNPPKSSIDLVIVGGESGPKKRPFELDWARSVRDQCREARVPFFMEQVDKVREIPQDLMIREMPR